MLTCMYCVHVYMYMYLQCIWLIEYDGKEKIYV